MASKIQNEHVEFSELHFEAFSFSGFRLHISVKYFIEIAPVMQIYVQNS